MHTIGLRHCSYRHIDTARYYLNEDQVGLAVKQCGIPREDVFVSKSKYERVRGRNSSHTVRLASKIYHPEHGYEQTLEAVDDSLRKFGHGTFVATRCQGWQGDDSAMDILQSILTSTLSTVACRGKRRGWRHGGLSSPRGTPERSSRLGCRTSEWLISMALTSRVDYGQFPETHRRDDWGRV